MKMDMLDSIQTVMADRIGKSVRQKMIERALDGFEQYGATMERSDLDTRDWLIHAQEEAMDLALYLERLIQDLEASVQGGNEVLNAVGVASLNPASSGATQKEKK